MSNANIHGLDHNSNDNNNNNNIYRVQQYDMNSNESIFSKFMYKGEPREQTIRSYLKEAIYPFLTLKSFSFAVIILNVVMYIVSLCIHGLDNEAKLNYFLPPSSRTLHLLGNLFGYGMRNKPVEFYRWITHNFLHANFAHVFSNCFCILMFGTMLEYLIGTWRYISIYLLSGILGGLFSVLIKPEVSSVGASICCYGAISAILGFDIINWNYLPVIYGTPNKCLILMIPLLMILFTLPMTFTPFRGTAFSMDNRVNFLGHLGGIIFGLLLSFFIIKPKDPSDSSSKVNKILFYCGIAACAIFALTGFLCFYLMNKYRLY
jgi:membrane associated rhomboid family serine protease